MICYKSETKEYISVIKRNWSSMERWFAFRNGNCVEMKEDDALLYGSDRGYMFFYENILL